MAEHSAPRVFVVVLNFNGLDDTLVCLESLRSVDDAAIVLVDNASDVDPAEAARRVMPGLTYVRTERNLGYAGGNNRGITVALDRGADFVLILNNDTTVSSELVSVLLQAFEHQPDLGVAGPVINAMDRPDEIMTYAAAFNRGPSTGFFERVPVPLDAQPPAIADVDIVNGCCMMVRADVFRAIGAFDEDLFIVHEESDLCLRALRAGFRCGLVGRAGLVWHKGSSAFDRTGRQIQRYFDTRNLFHLLRRHARHVPGSRPLLPSLFAALRYAYYRFTLEEEAGKTAAARAVVDGVYDAALGRFGAYERRPRPGAGLLGAGFRLTRRLRLVAA